MFYREGRGIHNNRGGRTESELMYIDLDAQFKKSMVATVSAIGGDACWYHGARCTRRLFRDDSSGPAGQPEEYEFLVVRTGRDALLGPAERNDLGSGSGSL